jgi:hypothetical protein
MKPLARKSDPTVEPVDEVAGLDRALDKTYIRMRERARAAWEHHHAGEDPSDACVSVRIAPAADASATSARKKTAALVSYQIAFALKKSPSVTTQGQDLRIARHGAELVSPY